MTKDRFTPRIGDMGLAPGGGFAMWMVRWGTGVPRFKFGRFIRDPAIYGHAAVCVGTYEIPTPRGTKAPSPAEVMIIEATPAGVIERNVPIIHFDWSSEGAFDGQLTDEKRREVCRLATGQLGAGYDWPNIAGFLFRWFRPTWQGPPEPDGWDDKTICSELTVWLWRQVGVVGVCDPFAPGNVSPNMLRVVLGPHRPKTGKF